MAGSARHADMAEIRWRGAEGWCIEVRGHVHARAHHIAMEAAASKTSTSKPTMEAAAAKPARVSMLRRQAEQRC
ncbi:MAG: hypothetical protein AB7E29_11200 [Xanthobacter sp.]